MACKFITKELTLTVIMCG